MKLPHHRRGDTQNNNPCNLLKRRVSCRRGSGRPSDVVFGIDNLTGGVWETRDGLNPSQRVGKSLQSATARIIPKSVRLRSSETLISSDGSVDEEIPEEMQTLPTGQQKCFYCGAWKFSMKCESCGKGFDFSDIDSAVQKGTPSKLVAMRGQVCTRSIVTRSIRKTSVSRQDDTV